MSQGLQIWDAGGNLQFDSTVAVGGVPLGFFEVLSGGSTFTFPDFQTETGIAIYARGGTRVLLYTTDNSLGYLRFVFSAFNAGVIVVLFAR